MKLMLSLNSAYDVQLALRDFLLASRKRQKWSVEKLAEMSGVPYGTIRKFESTGNISFRQFLLLCEALGKLSPLLQMTQEKALPASIAEVLNNA